MIKSAVFTLSFTFASAAFASASLPTFLPDGKYKFECTYTGVANIDGIGFSRRAGVVRGTRLVVSYGDTYVSRTSGVRYPKDGSGQRYKYESLNETKVKQLYRNQFLKSELINVRGWYDSNDGKGYQELAPKEYRTSNVVKVENGFEIQMNSQEDGGVVEPSFYDSFARTAADGSIEIVSYSRASHRVERKDYNEGEYSPGSDVSSENFFCRYFPSK